MTLFLALVAIQFVVESDLPKASYVIPTRQLVIASYVALALIAIETMVVYNVFNWHRVGEYFRGHKRALAKRAELKRQALGLPDGVHTNRVARALQSTLTRVTTSRHASGEGDGGTPFRRGAASPLAHVPSADSGAGSRAGLRRTDVQLEDDLQKAYHSWLAWAIDMACFFTIGLTYLLAAVLIFVAGKAREPDLCARTGAAGCDKNMAMGRRVLPE